MLEDDVVVAMKKTMASASSSRGGSGGKGKGKRSRRDCDAEQKPSGGVSVHQASGP